ncbi:TolC family protein [Glaciecola sp. XM2]|jgi:outer membrane protein TolC|uniref:TolC family protein n=1 Tax=Glaciecola sp. XM2 TaxID=1914931 RepID=UPI001BDECA6B|nr:TolC family protein [Glaciecola sp. XM2]MBT1449273.1 TolC family protein [Glaciecola sp. XM2]
MRYRIAFLSILIMLMLSHNAIANKADFLTLEDAIAAAIKQDPWLTGSQYREDALLASSVSASSLPDPVVSIGLANLPTDGFAFDQEPMTQLKAGVSQMFPRGDSLDIKRKQLEELAKQHPIMRKDRVAKTTLAVSVKWLEIFRAQQTISLIEQDRALFEQLGDVAQASYSSAVGKVRQQDIVRAQLELTRLDDRLTKLHSQKEQALAELLEWLSDDTTWTSNQMRYKQMVSLPAATPSIKPLYADAEQALNSRDTQRLAHVLVSHPYVLAIEQKIRASKTGIELAKQQYKPQWGVNASYAYRADDQLDRSRADFISVGVSFDVPVFTSNKQDQDVSAAISQTEAIKTEKRLAIRSLLSQLQSAYASHLRLLQRETLYQTDILVQMSEQAEASLTAYTNDDGDFAEVVRARIADLNARIDALNIEIDLLKSRSQLNYFFSDGQDVTHRIGEN